MVRKIIYLLLLFTISGCASVNIPNYIQDKNPYKKSFYADYFDVLTATSQTLTDYGWIISSQSDPSVFERSKVQEGFQKEQVLIFTEIRQTSLFLGSRYARVNAFLRAGTDNATEVEIRYLTVTSVPFKSFFNYRKDRTVERMFKHIEELLG